MKQKKVIPKGPWCYSYDFDIKVPTCDYFAKAYPDIPYCWKNSPDFNHSKKAIRLKEEISKNGYSMVLKHSACPKLKEKG